MGRRRAAAALLVLLAAAAVVAGSAAGQPTNRFQNDDVAHEPDTAADEALLGDDADGASGNGFGPGEWAEGRFDLVLDGYVSNNGFDVVEPNSVLADLLREAGGDPEGERYMLPGLVTHDARWGWFHDQGSGGYLQEAGAGGDEPDGVIDDGDDDHAADVGYGDWRSDPTACPAGQPSCWRATGPWDEFLWRGPNPHVPENATYAADEPADPEDPPVASYPQDELYGFVQPGTHRSWFVTLFSDERSDEIFRRPGNGVVSGEADGWQVPDFQYRWDDQAWYGVLAVNDDQSLLMATEVRVAANPTELSPPPWGPLRYDVAEATAVDTDMYSTVHPRAETLYRTAVWDPGDERDGLQDRGPVPDHGVKGKVKDLYDRGTLGVLTDVWREVQPIWEEVRHLAEGSQAVADDLVFPPYPHEPNHPGDEYPAAEKNRLAEYHWGLSDEPYYEPTQNWSGYADGEHLWVDFQNRYGIYGVAVHGAFGLQLGANTGAPSDPKAQGTQGPGMLSVFGHVGTWWDRTDDTWVGNIQGIHRPTSRDQPYDGGGVDDPNDYDHYEGNNGFTEPEWRSTCQVGVNVTLVPLSGNTWNGEPAWGTTDPPVGVYRYPIFAEERAVLDVAENGTSGVDNATARYRQAGPVGVEVSCEDLPNKDGQWFPDTGVILPKGTATYPIKVVVEAEMEGHRIPRSGGASLAGETVRDVDVIEAWS